MLRRTLFAALVIAAPSITPAQIVARPQTVAKPQLSMIVREPSLYVFDHYKMNAQDFLLHYMDDFTGKAHSTEPWLGIQGMGADKAGNAYAAVYVGPSQPTQIVKLRYPIRFTGPLKRAMDVTTDAQGRIYIIDADLGQVVRIDDMTGANLVTFGGLGSGIGQFKYPEGIAVDRNGRIYIADTGNNRIVRIDDMTGEGWRTYDGAAYGGQGLQVHLPQKIAVDSKSRLYYIRADRIIRVDDMAGANMVTWGRNDGVTTGFVLVKPSDIAIDANDRIYIADAESGFVTRIDDMTGASRTLLYKDATGEMWKRPSVLTVFYPRADRTIIR